jgi:ribonuclease P protein component
LNHRKADRRSRILRSRAEFEAVLTAGARLATPNFILRMRANGCGTGARLGIIAGRRAASRAVDRNRARRLIRETFRSVSAKIGPCDVAIQLRTDLRTLDNVAVRAELERLFAPLIRQNVTASPAAAAHE